MVFSAAPEVRGHGLLFALVTRLFRHATGRGAGRNAFIAFTLTRAITFTRAIVRAMAMLAWLAWPTIYPGLAHLGVAEAANFEPWTSGTLPLFTLGALGGGQLSLASQKGTVTLVHFFATWCEACRQELPALNRFADRHKPGGLRVLAIDAGESEPAIRRFLTASPLAIPILLDPERAVIKAWDIATLPTTIVLDTALTPGWAAPGDVDWDDPKVGQLFDQLLPMRPDVKSRRDP